MPGSRPRAIDAFAEALFALRFLIRSGVISMADARDVALGLRHELRAA